MTRAELIEELNRRIGAAQALHGSSDEDARKAHIQHHHMTAVRHEGWSAIYREVVATLLELRRWAESLPE